MVGKDHLNIVPRLRVSHFSHSNLLIISRYTPQARQYKRSSIHSFLPKIPIHLNSAESILRSMLDWNVCSLRRVVSIIRPYRSSSHRRRYQIVERKISSSHHEAMYHHLRSMTSFLQMLKKLDCMCSLLQKVKIQRSSRILSRRLYSL